MFSFTNCCYIFYFHTGYLALINCGYDIEVYYACEIDQDARRVTSYHFGNNVQQLGSVTEINEDALRSLGKINLLIGGSPCSDLSLVNREAKGLFGMIKICKKLFIAFLCSYIV